MEKLYGDAVSVGDVHRLGEYTVTEESIIDFAKQWDPQWFHVDAQAAETGPFGGLIASGIQTLAIFQKLAVETVFNRFHVLCGRDVAAARFVRPVRPGAVVGGTMTVTRVGQEPRRHRTLVTYAVELTDQHDDVLLTTEMTVYLRLP